MSKKPRILVLCCGAGTVAIPFWEAGWEVVAIDINPQIEPRRGLTIIHDDIRNVNPDGLGRFDAVWFSPPCERFSKAARRMNHFDTSPGEGVWPALTEGAAEAIEIVAAGLGFMRLANYWWMENPVGALRHIGATQGLPRVTIDYCMYNDEQGRKKPTDLFGNFPVKWKPRPNCCHDPWSHTNIRDIKSYLDRSAIPRELVYDIIDSL
tara:strand:+ start:371 stop:994 length:624 start_codon:yes stop_codon:yes gene_type:complete